MRSSLAQAPRAALKPQQLARKLIRNPALLNQVFQGLDADAAAVRFGCAKALCLVAEAEPGVLYPAFDSFVALLQHPNKIFPWQAARILSHLARVDTAGRFAAVFKTYFAPVAGPVMITAANAIQGGARIAVAQPRLADRIASEILKVRRARYQTPECRNVAAGHALLALGDMFHLLKHRNPALRFVRSQLRNPRPATRKKAEKLLRQLG